MSTQTELEKSPSKPRPGLIALLVLLLAAPAAMAAPGPKHGDSAYRSGGHHRNHIGVRVGHRYGHRHRHYYRPHIYFHYRPYSHYYRPYRYGYYPYYYGYRGPYRSIDRSRYGALDLDIKPEDAQVYLNGKYVGTTDQYDGWPRHLWLTEDSYELIIYSPGHETLVRQVAVGPGEVVRLKERMRPGEATDPSALSKAGATELDHDGYGYSARVPSAPAAQAPAVKPVPRRPATPRSALPQAPRGDDARRDLRQEPATVQLVVTPSDASVYLDGRFVGSGRASQELLVDAGPHVLQVVRPGFQDQELDLEAKAGERLRLEVTLEKR